MVNRAAAGIAFLILRRIRACGYCSFKTWCGLLAFGTVASRHKLPALNKKAFQHWDQFGSRSRPCPTLEAQSYRLES